LTVRFRGITRSVSFRDCWNSPTVTSWCTLAARTIQWLLLVPFIFSYLTTPEATVWLIFQTILGLHILADMGMTTTFTRAFSSAFGGAEALENVDGSARADGISRVNTKLLAEIMAASKVAYRRLALTATIGLALGATAFLLNPIKAVPAPIEAWIAWLAILVSSTYTFYGNCHISYLQAAEQIPAINRARAITIILGTVSCILVLHWGGGLLGVMVAQQFWQVIFVIGIANRVRLDGTLAAERADVGSVAHVWRYVWPATWRSGIGLFVGFAVVQISGLVYAQYATAAQAATYLFTLRLLQGMTMFSAPPFYTRIPRMSRLWVQGDRASLVALIERAMRHVFWIYSGLLVSIGLIMPPLLAAVGSNVTFPGGTVWAIFGVAGLVERIGAAHVQVYSLSNKVVWHVANGLGGTIFILVSIFLVPRMELLGFALASLTSAMAYAAYSLLMCRNLLGARFVALSVIAASMPVTLVVAYLAYAKYFIA
jgi:hypothetical protein